MCNMARIIINKEIKQCFFNYSKTSKNDVCQNGSTVTLFSQL